MKQNAKRISLSPFSHVLERVKAWEYLVSGVQVKFKGFIPSLGFILSLRVLF